MNYKVEVERDGDEILAVYVRIADGKVARTVEIEAGSCYADEDAAGNLLGVEMLAPATVTIKVRVAKAVKEHYPKYPSIDDVLNRAMETVNA